MSYIGDMAENAIKIQHKIKGSGIYILSKDHSSGNVGNIYSHIKDSLMKPHGTSTVDTADKGHVTTYSYGRPSLHITNVREMLSERTTYSYAN